MIQDLAGGNRLILTEYKRNGQVHFDFNTFLSSRTLADALQETRVLFPKTSRVATTIVINHARRR